MSSSTHNVRTYSRNMWGLYKNIAALQGSNKQTKNTSPQPDLDLNNNPVSIICRCCCCPRMGRRMEAASVTCWSFSWPIPIDLNFAFTWKNTRTCFYYLHTQFATLSWPIYHNTTLSPSSPTFATVKVHFLLLCHPHTMAPPFLVPLNTRGGCAPPVITLLN